MSIYVYIRQYVSIYVCICLYMSGGQRTEARIIGVIRLPKKHIDDRILHCL